MSKKYDKFLRNRDWLYHKYWVEKLNLPQIADIIGCDDSTVFFAFEKLGILRRTKSEVTKGKNNPFYGKHHTKKYPNLSDKGWLYQKYWIEKLSIYQIANIIGCCHYTVWKALKRLNIPRRTNSEAHKGLQAGKNHPLYNKHHTEGAKAKISKTRIERGVAKGELNPFYGKHHTKETKAKMDEARKHRKFPKIDTKPELIFIGIYRKFGLEKRIEDTRDNSFHIGRLNPDFIIRDMKIAIFINGDYWHSPLLRYNIRDTQRVDFQIRICKRHKWVPLIIWESDLLRKDAEQFVLSELKKHKVF